MMKMPRLDYDRTPFLIIWETTQSCDLACLHCRASAQPLRHCDELTTEEGEDLLRQAAGLGTPIFILSGGDPLKRPDLMRLIRTGANLGLRMATIPAATERLTEEVVKDLKQAGLSQMAQSLDYPTAALHDAFRGVPGAYAKTMQAVEWAHRHDLPLQINTTLCAESAPYLEEMAELVTRLGVVFWEVFFLIPTGRGSKLNGLTAEQCEELFEILYQVQKRSEFLVKVTEAPHFRRYVMMREGLRGSAPTGSRSGQSLPAQLVRTEGPGHTIGLASQGVNSGNGFLFVSHLGDVYPSGFLPVKAGNIRTAPLASMYRETPLFRSLRTPESFLGVCGRCEFRGVCGGSRSRAFALTGNYLASDPWCAYRPSPAGAAAQAGV
ncbi:MAG TPA: TIGR04053 family radical SAM/SPASM domain-containing protein [Candidatus Polarisedimenticolia bacterium]|nr:TIGR04053 family radical SAM/SPASM domain-containing protein [Candidatus Polarisedimenticolia bacterium]